MAKYWWDLRPTRWAPEPAEPVIVSTRSGQSIKGLAIVVSPSGIVLAAAKVAGLGQNNAVVWASLAGQVVIPSENIDYWQRVNAEMVE